VDLGALLAEPRVIVIMGVAASGKSTAGAALAAALGWAFYDGDDYHSQANKAKMHSGVPLTDDDRVPWLSTLRTLIADLIGRDEHAVLACSALKAWHREALVPESAPPGSVRFAYLDVPRATLEARLAERRHFFPVSLLESQLEALEKPRDAVWLDGTQPVSEIVSTVRSALRI
jgi:gluconokinase